MRVILGVFIITFNILLFFRPIIYAEERRFDLSDREKIEHAVRHLGPRLKPTFDRLIKTIAEERINAAELEASSLIKGMNKRRKNAGFRPLSPNSELIIKKQAIDRYLQN